jgi:hypothetical protein
VRANNCVPTASSNNALLTFNYQSQDDQVKSYLRELNKITEDLICWSTMYSVIHPRPVAQADSLVNFGSLAWMHGMRSILLAAEVIMFQVVILPPS